jgi:integrase
VGTGHLDQQHLIGSLRCRCQEMLFQLHHVFWGPWKGLIKERRKRGKLQLGDRGGMMQQGKHGWGHLLREGNTVCSKAMLILLLCHPQVHPLCSNAPTLDKTMRDRKHLVFAEVEKLLEAAKGGRHAARDRCLLLLMFRHGLRVSEACGLQLSQVDTGSRVLHVARLKQGLSTTHPLRGDEIRAMKAWLVERARMKPGWCFKRGYRWK